MKLRRGLFRIWLAVTAAWLVGLLAYTFAVGIEPFTATLAYLMILGLLPALALLLIGKLSLWIARGFSDNPALAPSAYERSVTNLTLLFASFGGAVNLYTYGNETAWSIPWPSMAAYVFGSAVAVGMLGLLVGLIAYRNRKTSEA